MRRSFDANALAIEFARFGGGAPRLQRIERFKKNFGAVVELQYRTIFFRVALVRAFDRLRYRAIDTDDGDTPPIESIEIGTRHHLVGIVLHIRAPA